MKTSTTYTNFVYKAFYFYLLLFFYFVCFCRYQNNKNIAKRQCHRAHSMQIYLLLLCHISNIYLFFDLLYLTNNLLGILSNVALYGRENDYVLFAYYDPCRLACATFCLFGIVFWLFCCCCCCSFFKYLSFILLYTLNV